jgi:hypothetical protein
VQHRPLDADRLVGPATVAQPADAFGAANASPTADEVTSLNPAGALWRSGDARRRAR